MSNNLCYTEASGVRKSRLKYFLTSGLCTTAMLLSANAGYAQDQSPADGDEERIIVTGSRLIRSDLSAPSPTAVMNAADLRAAGSITIEETLNELPQLQAAGTAQNNADNGSGVLTANLRGLGDERTLVLVNGRRFIPSSSTGIVDLTNIPDALVKRVEIMTGGASAVYGSDAIAGAVNFILMDDFEGIEAGYQYGSAFEGDGANHKIDLTIGGNFADGRGNVVVSGSFSKRDPVFMADREFSAVSLFDRDGQLVPGGSGNIPGTRVGLTQDQRDSFVGLDLSDAGAGCDVGGIRFGEGGEVLPFCDPEDRFNFSPLNYLTRPLERYQLTSLAHYDITDNVTAYVETHFAHHRNAYQQAPEAFSPTTQGDPDDNLVIVDYANNPLLPDPVRDMIAANTAIFDPTDSGNATFTSKGRRANEIGPRHFSFEKTSFSVTTGLRGEYTIADNPWTWDTNYTFQRGTSQEYTTGEISGLALTLGLDAIDDGEGGAVCRNNLINCVPVNIFGLDSITPDAVDFLAPPHGSARVFQRQIFSGVTTGDLFELPAGPVATAFGVEYRKDQFDFRPDAAEASGQFGATPRLPSSNSFDVKEVFAESRLPLVSDAPFAEDLALEVAARYSDYSSIGSGFTWKVGGEWAPVEEFRFRAAFNRAVRAPNLNELFSPITGGFTSGDDPCANPGKSAADSQLCVAQGVPQADVADFEQIGLGVTQRRGGNPNLQEEKSDTFTVGFVWRPEAVEGLNVTLDYYKVKVKDAISTINAQTMMNACFASGDNSSIFCQNIVRNSTTGQIRRVNAQFENISNLEVSGIDFQVDYSFDADALALPGEAATIFLQSVIGYQFDDIEVPFEGQDPVDCSGVFGGVCSGQGTPITSKTKGVFNATWMSGPATVRAQARYLGGLDRLAADVDGQAIQSVGATWYFDLNASFVFGENENIEVFGGITNLFDKQPPVLGFFDVGDSNTDPSLYDTVGRRFNTGVRVRF